MWSYNCNPSNELYHYGVVGMKWGHRKNYDSISDRKLYKYLKKDIENAKSNQYKKLDQYRSDLSIGENSKKALDQKNADYNKIRNSPEYKKALRDISKHEKKWDLVETGKITEEQWTKEYDSLAEPLAKVSKDFGLISTFTNRGITYADSFLNSYGKNISIGYLKDLGYDDEIAKQYTERLIRSGKALY